MKAGIYIPGFGEAFQGTSVKAYADRLAHQLNINHPDPSAVFYTKEEKLEYGQRSQSVTGKLDELINEVATWETAGIWNFLSLYSLKTHQHYWPKQPGGSSCLGPVLTMMQTKGMIP